MEPLNDNELRNLLRQWEAPAAPPYLEDRIFGVSAKQPWYRWLLTGTIRLPVPAFVLLLLGLPVFMYLMDRDRQAPPALADEVSLSDFQPVSELKPRIIRRIYESN
jgi:hypothetical protein